MALREQALGPVKLGGLPEELNIDGSSRLGVVFRIIVPAGSGSLG